MPSHRLAIALLSALVASCGQMPTTGPTTVAVEETDNARIPSGVVQLVDIDENIARRLAQQQIQPLFSDSLGDSAPPAQLIGPGDSLEVVIWETPPATLFGTSNIDPRVMTTSSPITLPPQMVDRDGYISVPFAGRVRAAGLTPVATAGAVKDALKGKANQPQVVVRVQQNASSTVAVVGEVNVNVRMPLTAAGERVLDALAAAGGVRQPLTKVALQITRGAESRALPLEQIVRDPRQNVHLHPGDVVAALFQPQSFVSLGATGRQDEVPFEAQGISLAQALGRIGGLTDNRSDPHGVFVFRFERQSAIEWPRQPVVATPDGMVPVVYRLDMARPASFFAMQSFPIHHKDIVFVSNAPLADLQKFLNLVFSISYPVLNTYRSLN